MELYVLDNNKSFAKKYICFLKVFLILIYMCGLF